MSESWCVTHARQMGHETEDTLAGGMRCLDCSTMPPAGTLRGVEAMKTTTLSGMAKPNMVMRSLRVPEKLWEAAKAKADEREENISDVIREALERYVRRR